MMNLRESIRRILRESVPPQVRRRQEEFDRIFKHYRDAFIGYEYKSFKSFWNVTLEATMETLYHAWFSKTVKDDDWEESAEYIENYLIKKYKDETKQMWEKKHHKRLNESEEETNYLPIIENIVEPFKEDECICNIDMWYDDEDDMYSVYLVFGTEELDGKFTSDGKFGYVRKKQKEVEETIKSYLPIKNIRVGSYGTPHCEWSSLNESEEKKQSLLSLIEEHGLYEFIKMTGLSLKEIISKTGEPSRELLEKYIEDFMEVEAQTIVGSDGDRGIVYPIPLSKTKEVESFYLSKGGITVEVNVYDLKGKLVAGSIERLPNLSDDEIYKIVKKLIDWGGDDDYYEI